MRLIFAALFLAFAAFFSSIELSSQSGNGSRNSRVSGSKSRSQQLRSQSRSENDYSDSTESRSRSESVPGFIRGTPASPQHTERPVVNRPREVPRRRAFSAQPEQLYSTSGSIPSYAYFGHPGAPEYYNRQPEPPHAFDNSYRPDSPYRPDAFEIPRSPSPPNPQKPHSPRSSTDSNPPHYHLGLNTF